MLEAVGISKRFGYRTIFEEESFRLDAGSVLGVCGANGVGKSTLLSCLAGLSNFSGGHVFFKNEEIGRNNTTYRQNFFLIDQNYYLYEDLSLEDNLNFFLRLHQVGDEERKGLDAVLELFGLSQFLNFKVRFFSSGMKRKVRLVVMFFVKADCILLDEPFNNLDIRTSEILREFLLERKKQGSGIILVTHQPEQTFSLTDNFLLMHKKKFKSCKRQDFDDVEGFQAFLKGMNH